jgi:hypothetical protein
MGITITVLWSVLCADVIKTNNPFLKEVMSSEKYN